MIANEGRYLITQRRPAAVLPLLWEFPGGRVEAGESDADALKREVLPSPLGADRSGTISSRSSATPTSTTSSISTSTSAAWSPGDLRAVNVQDFRWVKSDEFDQYPFTPADEASMNKLLGLP